MKKHFLKLGTLAIALVLIGAGCSSTCVTDTDWGSCINDNGADTGLLGSWTLVSQQVIAPGGTVENPFNGRTLTFTEGASFNGYSEDWSPEFVEKAVYTPDLQLLVSECETVGTGGGSWAAVPTTDDVGNTIMELWIVPAGENVQVTCNAGGEVDVVSSSASTPLGIGPVDSGPNGPYVKYTYAIGEGGNLLQIIQTIPQALTDQTGDVTNLFLFSR